MIVCFADDARRRSPSRPGMGPLVALGGFLLADDAMMGLEGDMNALCAEYGFPPGQPFRWSPGRDLWMREALVGERRQEFWFRLLALATAAGAKALVVVADSRMVAVPPSSSSPPRRATGRGCLDPRPVGGISRDYAASVTGIRTSDRSPDRLSPRRRRRAPPARSRRGTAGRGQGRSAAWPRQRCTSCAGCSRRSPRRTPPP